MWFKVDDQSPFHPKFVAAGIAPLGLWLRAGAWSAQQLTDGFVPADMIASFGAKTSHAERLVKVGLWVTEPDGYRFHDWLDYQPSAHDMQLIREKEGRAGAQGNHQRWHANRGIYDPGCKFCLADRGGAS